MPLKVYRKRKKGKTVEHQLDEQAAHIARLRKADAAAEKKRRSSRISRLKRGIKSILSGPGHSPAGKKYVAKVKKKKAEMKGFTGGTKRQLQGLSKADYNAVMNAMGRRK
jgi:hypothetical protein